MLATAASFVLVSVAQIAGAEGATTAVWVYVIVCIFALLHTLYTSDGISRALLFWRLVGRMILHYKLVRLWGRHSDLEAPELEGVYAQLHQRYAPRVHAPHAVCTILNTMHCLVMPKRTTLHTPRSALYTPYDRHCTAHPHYILKSYSYTHHLLHPRRTTFYSPSCSPQLAHYTNLSQT